MAKQVISVYSVDAASITCGSAQAEPAKSTIHLNAKIGNLFRARSVDDDYWARIFKKMSGFIGVNRYTFRMTLSEQDPLRIVMKSRDCIVLLSERIMHCYYKDNPNIGTQT